MRKYKKFVLPVMRIVLFVAGAAVGYIVMWQVLRAYPNSLAAAYKYVYCSGTGFLLGAVLALSARSVLWLAFTVADGLKNLFRGAKPADVAGVFIGLAAGFMLAYLFDFLLSLVLKIFSLRILLDVLFALAAAGLCMYGVLHALHASDASDDAPSSGMRTDTAYTGGYVLHSSAFFCDGLLPFCRDWLIGQAAVTEGTVAELIAAGENGQAALKIYGELLSAGAVHTVSAGKGEEKEQVAAYAEAHKCKIVTAEENAWENVKAPVLAFSSLFGASRKRETEKTSTESADNSCASD